MKRYRIMAKDGIGTFCVGITSDAELAYAYPRTSHPFFNAWVEEYEVEEETDASQR